MYWIGYENKLQGHIGTTQFLKVNNDLHLKAYSNNSNRYRKIVINLIKKNNELFKFSQLCGKFPI